MKYQLLLLLFISLNTCAQHSDSTLARLDRLEQAVASMSYDMEQSLRQYTTGIVIAMVGTGITTGGVFMKGGEARLGITAGGAVLSVIGVALMLEHHSTIARAGRWRWNGNAIVYKF